MALDPVDYAVISQGLIAAAREMGVKLIRSAYSTILREAQDGSAALMDRDGNVVSQAELIPMQLGPMKATRSPGRISKSIPSKATSPVLKRFVTPRNVNIQTS